MKLHCWLRYSINALDCLGFFLAEEIDENSCVSWLEVIFNIPIVNQFRDSFVISFGDIT